MGGFFKKGRVEPKEGAASENLDCLEERLGRKSQSNCSSCSEFALAWESGADSREWHLFSWADTLKVAPNGSEERKETDS